MRGQFTRDARAAARRTIVAQHPRRQTARAAAESAQGMPRAPFRNLMRPDWLSAAAQSYARVEYTPGRP
jgi:hypothetical protein